MDVAHSTVRVSGRSLEVQTFGGTEPALVLLHEGLGSISTWRDFPRRLAADSGCRTIAYSRYGYGQSDILREPFAVDYMHREALETLPELLAALDVADPILLGHSDGASIAIIHAGAGHSVSGLVLLAPHVFVEDVSVESIAAARAAFETTDWREKLARHHRDPLATFYGWNDIWLHPEFRAWNIEPFLPDIECPVLAIQGEQDEYGTMAQIEAIAVQVRGPCAVMKLAACGHGVHRDQPDKTAAAVVGFLRRIQGGAKGSAPGAP